MFTAPNPTVARGFLAIALVALSWLFPSFLRAQTLPTGFLNAKIQDGYVAPMGTVFTRDGQRMFVWDKSGKVWVSAWNGSQYVKQTAAVLNISEEVGDWRDFGLLSFCLDPNYDQNGLIYLFYVVDRHHLLNFGTAAYDAATNDYFKATISRVTRYKFQTVGSNLTADVASRKVLLGETRSTGVPLTHESHAGGTILFGRDGSLLVSTGDNASYSSIDKGSATETYFQQAISDGIMRANENVGAFRSQVLNSHCGKVLRTDPNTGDGLTSNPFYDATNSRSARSRVWALGLRNPLRMTLQPNTGSTSITDGNPGTLVVGDVGWNNWEDMHVIRQAGENAGWPIFEGLEESADYGPVATTLENKDEPNPTNTCNKPFLTFADLLKQPTNPVQTVLNPCNNQPLPNLQRRYTHSRPALDWKHGADIARLPTFTGSTAAVNVLSGSTGIPFPGNCSVGGAYYAGTAFPAAYQNTYYFADYGANWIRAATLGADGAVQQVRTFLPNGSGKGIVDLEYGPLDGALYYTNINTGEIMKISFGGNQPPFAVATADKQSGTSPLTVNFRGSTSSDPDGDPLSYLWEFGDGTTSTVANPTKTFSSGTPRGYTVQLTVNDGRGLMDSKTLTISLNNAAPTARITTPTNNTQYSLDRPTNYTLTANVTDEDPASLSYAWQVALRHNNHEHREPVQTGPSPTVTISPVGCDGETYYYLITLKITDQGGLTALDSVKIYPNCSSLNLSVTNAQATPQTNAMLVTWTNPTGTFDDVLVVAKAGSGFLDKPTQSTYAANASFTGNGATLEGGKVVYQGRGTSVTVTELTGGQRYFFRIYTRSGSAWTGGVEVNAVPVAPAATSFDPGKCYRLVSRVSGKVLGVENGAVTDGAGIKQRTDANQMWQQWRIQSTGDGYFRLAAVHSNKLLDVSNISQQDRAWVHQWSLTGAGNQQWAIARNAEGFYALKARHSGKLLNVEGNTEGGNVTQLTANGTSAQQWSVEERTCITPISFDPNKCYRLTSRLSGKVIGVDGGSTTNGVVIRQRSNANRMWQQWRIWSVAGGFFELAAVHSNKMVDVSGVSQQDGVNLIQWQATGGVNQHWTIKRNSEGYYVFEAQHSGKAMDVKDNNSADGAAIIQRTSDGTFSQQWSVNEATCSSNNSARIGDESNPLTQVGINPDLEPVTVIRLWPNPAQDYVLIDLRAADGQTAELSLTAIDGKVMRQTRVQTGAEPVYRLNTTPYADGQYLVRVKTPGQPVTTLRLVLTR